MTENFNRPKLEKIGGWLSLFIFGRIIVEPTHTVYELFTGYNELEKSGAKESLRLIFEFLVATPLGLFILLETFFSIYVGIVLIRKYSFAPLITKIFLTLTVLTFPYAVIHNVGSFLGFVFNIIWILYFNSSLRVQIVYGCNSPSYGELISPHFYKLKTLKKSLSTTTETFMKKGRIRKIRKSIKEGKIDKLLEETNNSLRKLYIEDLISLGLKAKDPLLAVLDHPNPEVRKNASHILEKIGPRDYLP